MFNGPETFGKLKAMREEFWPLFSCFTTEQSAVKASLFVNSLAKKCRNASDTSKSVILGETRSDKGLPVEMSALEILYGGQFTSSTQWIKQSYLSIPPSTQHHRLFRNLPSRSSCCTRLPSVDVKLAIFRDCSFREEIDRSVF